MYALQISKNKKAYATAAQSSGLDELLFKMSNPRFHGNNKRRVVELFVDGRKPRVVVQRNG